VLAVDDDESMRRLITDYLGDNEVSVTALGSGRGIADAMARETIDLLILDVRLPGEDGMQIAHQLRQASDIPIIMLSGVSDEADRVMGLEMGADDYLTKPFSPRELLARIRTLLRRARAQGSRGDGPGRIRAYRFAACELGVRQRQLTTPEGGALVLSNGEFNLLTAFLAAPGRILSRERLLSLSHAHDDEVYDRSIDVRIARLRRKIGAGGARCGLIRTERGAGYVFTAAVELVR